MNVLYRSAMTYLHRSAEEACLVIPLGLQVSVDPCCFVGCTNYSTSYLTSLSLWPNFWMWLLKTDGSWKTLTYLLVTFLALSGFQETRDLKERFKLKREVQPAVDLPISAQQDNRALNSPDCNICQSRTAHPSITSCGRLLSPIPIKFQIYCLVKSGSAIKLGFHLSIN